MKPTISFLLGSGFSIPEGLPGVKAINARLSKIDESEILIHTDQRAFFLNGQEDRNRWSNRDERLFLQQFLEFYNEVVLGSGHTFHYEEFYDFYSLYLYEGKNKKQINAFFKEFNKKNFKHSIPHKNCYNRISDFNRTFSQLLAEQLSRPKYYADTNYANYPPYDSFVSFLRDLITQNEVKIHTLNHDLFFDFLGSRHMDLWQHFSDGYKLEGSPYYGTLNHQFDHYNIETKINKSYTVKLERFIDKFDKPLCLYKLHGSINTILVRLSNQEQSVVRIKRDYAISQVFIEIMDPITQDYKFDNLWDETVPDFLSGTTNKMKFYNSDPHYKNLFKYFETNLLVSKLLIVIGYGFQDSGINDYIETHFLSKEGKMIVIDPNKPDTGLLEKYNAVYIPKSVTDVGYEEYLSLI